MKNLQRVKVQYNTQRLMSRLYYPSNSNIKYTTKEIKKKIHPSSFRRWLASTKSKKRCSIERKKKIRPKPQKKKKKYFYPPLNISISAESSCIYLTDMDGRLRMCIILVGEGVYRHVKTKEEGILYIYISFVTRFFFFFKKKTERKDHVTLA